MSVSVQSVADNHFYLATEHCRWKNNNITKTAAQMKHLRSISVGCLLAGTDPIVLCLPRLANGVLFCVLITSSSMAFLNFLTPKIVTLSRIK